jgi:hypothetical protein
MVNPLSFHAQMVETRGSRPSFDGSVELPSFGPDDGDLGESEFDRPRQSLSSSRLNSESPLSRPYSTSNTILD